MKQIGLILGLSVWLVISPVSVSSQSDWMDGKVYCCLRSCS
jgi:hypothetical protein